MRAEVHGSVLQHTELRIRGHAMDLIACYVDDACALLGMPSPTSLAEAQRQLRIVEGLLASLVTERMPSAVAARVLSLRSDLSVHLSAAETLRALELTERTRTVLSRVAKLLRTGLDDLMHARRALTQD